MRQQLAITNVSPEHGKRSHPARCAGRALNLALLRKRSFHRKKAAVPCTAADFLRRGSPRRFTRRGKPKAQAVLLTCISSGFARPSRFPSGMPAHLCDPSMFTAAVPYGTHTSVVLHPFLYSLRGSFSQIRQHLGRYSIRSKYITRGPSLSIRAAPGPPPVMHPAQQTGALPFRSAPVIADSVQSFSR